MRSLGYNWSSSKESVQEQALKINDVSFLLGEIKHNEDLHWRKTVLSEVIVMILKRQGMKPQELVKQFMLMAGEGNLEYLYNIKTLSKKSIDAMIRKGELVLTSKSRLRQDDMEMIYWTEVKLASSLEIELV
jgi:hypothetical protein